MRIRAEASCKMRVILMKWPLPSLGRRVPVIIYSNSSWRSLIIQLRVPTFTVKFIDADTGEEIPGKDEVLIQKTPGTNVDLGEYLAISGYTLKATNVSTAKGYVFGNTVKVVTGNQGITYAFHKIRQNEIYTASAKATTVYTLQGETASDLSDVSKFVTVASNESTTPAASGYSLVWSTPISTTTSGNQQLLQK